MFDLEQLVLDQLVQMELGEGSRHRVGASERRRITPSGRAQIAALVRLATNLSLKGAR